MRWKKYAPIAMIIISGIICYFNSLHGDFIWDDNFLIKNNPRITHWRFIPEIFTKSIGSKTQSQEMFWRPLQIVSYSVDYHLWKYSVTGYHAVNIVLHIAVALCLYWLILIIFNSSLVAGFCAILFTVHPIQTETVAYISARADQLAALFILISYILYLKSERTKSIYPYIFMMISFVLALLAKENALILPLLLLLYHFVFRKKIAVKEFSALAIISALYLVLRLSVLKTTALNPATLGSALERLPGFFIAIAIYFRLLIVPFNLHAAYGRELFSFTDPAAIIGMLLSLGLLGYSFMKRKSNPLIFFSTGWFFLAILPTSNIYPISFYMAEHFLYVPGVGFFLMAALSILHDAIRNCPDDPRFHNLQGLVYQDVGQYEEAIASFKRAVTLDRGFGSAYNNLAAIYFFREQYKLAHEYIVKAMRAGYKVQPDFLADLKKQGYGTF